MFGVLVSNFLIFDTCRAGWAPRFLDLLGNDPASFSSRLASIALHRSTLDALLVDGQLLRSSSAMEDRMSISDYFQLRIRR